MTISTTILPLHALDLVDCATYIVSKPESERESIYCAAVDHFALPRCQQWDLMVECARLGWER